MIDLSTVYLGRKLHTPLVASASPLCKDVDNIRRMAEAGIGAVVLQSLFEEQIDAESAQLDRMLSSGVETYEAQSYFPDMTSYNIGPDGYLEHIHTLKRSVHVPVIASLNGVSLGGWVRYGRLMQQAGADALDSIYMTFRATPNCPARLSSSVIAPSWARSGRSSISRLR